MTTQIRMLLTEDIPLLKSMETGIKGDYVLQVAGNLMEGNNRLFGLFTDNKLVSIGGYSIFANQYAMLGRLRSDRRFIKNGYATQLMRHMRDAVFCLPHVQWVGANTQKDNISTRRVLEKINFSPLTTLHGALTNDVSALEKGVSPWTEIRNLDRKREWLTHTYIENKLIFPYECYYLFPSSPELFADDIINEWNVYENNDQSRFVITKKDRKKHHYLHIVYPWEDIFEQIGLWETVMRDYKYLKEKTNEESYIWYDMPKQQAQTLPKNHHWSLPSPWMLYGMDRVTWENE